MFSNQLDSPSTSKEITKCNKSPNLFCFLCSIFIVSNSKTYPLSKTNRELYYKCYSTTPEQNGADKFYSSNVFCYSCINNMKQHINFNKPLKYSKPAKWNQPNHLFETHQKSCYVCLAQKVQGIRFKISYEWPEFYQHNVSKPVLNTFSELEPPPEKQARHEPLSSSESDEEFTIYQPSNSKEFIPFTQPALNQLVKDLSLTKDQSMVLASCLLKHNALTPDCRVGFFSKRSSEIDEFFDEDSGGNPYLKNISGLFRWLNYEYVAEHWRLFIDSSKSSFKVVLLHNGNLLPSIPLLYSPVLKETYNDVKYALELIDYNSHKWKIIADLKLLNVICGVGSPSVKNPCVLCDWYGTHRSNKQYQQYHQDNIQRRTEFTVGRNSVVAKPLIDLNDVLLPPLHVKIGLIAQFIKKLDKNSPAYKFICNLLCYKSSAKLEAGQLDGPEIRKLMKNSDQFELYLSTVELEAWKAFKNVCNDFLGKNRTENYKELARDLVQKYERMGCNMSYKLHIIDKHIDDFPENCSDYSDEMGERFHQDIKKAEKQYQGRYDKNMLSDYCWFLKKEHPTEYRKGRRKSQFPFIETSI